MLIVRGIVRAGYPAADVDLPGDHVRDQAVAEFAVMALWIHVSQGKYTAQDQLRDPRPLNVRPAFECPQCGNPRVLLPETCPSCGSTEPPFAHVEFWKVDLERDAPLVEEAIDKLTRAVRAGAAAGLRALIVVHGYGSNGAGGRIGWAVREGLKNNHWADRIDEFIPCEELTEGSQLLTHLTRHRAALADSLRRSRMLGNAGVSALIFRKQDSQADSAIG